jgi:hypothetical protein
LLLKKFSFLGSGRKTGIFDVSSGVANPLLNPVSFAVNQKQNPTNGIAVMSGHILRDAGKATASALRGAIILLATPLPLWSSQQAMLAWNPSSHAGVVGYRIYYGPASGIYTHVVSVGNVTNAVVSGLAEAARYYFTATAVDALGLESSPSNEMTYDVPSVSVLAIRCAQTNGATATVSITASGAVPERWALESSADLAAWSTLARGTNVPVNVSVVTAGAPKQFFRLKSQ